MNDMHERPPRQPTPDVNPMVGLFAAIAMITFFGLLMAVCFINVINPPFIFVIFLGMCAGYGASEARRLEQGELAHQRLSSELYRR